MNVFVSRALPADVLEPIGAVARYTVWPHDVPPDRDTLLRESADIDGLLCLLTDGIDAAYLAAAPRLRVVSQMAVGTDNIDVAACAARGIAVGNTPGVLAETTADLAFALLLAAARRLTESERSLREGTWQTWAPFGYAGVDVHGATLGLVGLGAIGTAVARRAAGFGMTVLYAAPRRNESSEAATGARYLEMDDLLRASDFVSLHCPLTQATRHLIGRRELALMKPTAILVNTARGPVVDTDALVDALTAGVIRGAGLDVFETEPLPLDSPLMTAPNVTLLPHIGSASVATRTRMAQIAVANLVAGLTGEPLPHPVAPPLP